MDEAPGKGWGYSRASDTGKAGPSAQPPSRGVGTWEEQEVMVGMPRAGNQVTSWDGLWPLLPVGFPHFAYSKCS